MHKKRWQSLWVADERDIGSEAAVPKDIRWHAMENDSRRGRVPCVLENKRQKAGNPARTPDICKTSKSMKQEGVCIKKFLIISFTTDSLQSLI